MEAWKHRVPCIILGLLHRFLSRFVFEQPRQLLLEIHPNPELQNPDPQMARIHNRQIVHHMKAVQQVPGNQTNYLKLIGSRILHL